MRCPRRPATAPTTIIANTTASLGAIWLLCFLPIWEEKAEKVARWHALPTSTAMEKPAYRTQIEIRADGLFVDSQRLMSLPRLRVPDDERRGQNITKLYDRVVESHQCSKYCGEWRTEANLFVDQDTPAETVLSVLHTLQGAGIQTVGHVVWRTP